MKIKNLIDNNDEFEKIGREIEKYTNYILSDYLKKIDSLLERDLISKESKEFHDAVWGTIEINPGEILIIDSPLLQRLRRIRHLGLVNTLFCGADYSRFSHTIGVLFITERITNKISREIKKVRSDDVLFVDNRLSIKQLLRLAAIFHDVGHLFCSHASERYYEGPFFSRHEEIEKINVLLMKKLGLPKVSLSEILSILIIRSTSVKKLLLKSSCLLDNVSCSQLNQVDIIIEYISCFILGLPKCINSLPFSQVISGPIDADKCDYLARDSHTTGVPVAVDIYRLIQKIRVIKKVPREFAGAWTDKKDCMEEECFLMGVLYSAVSTIEQILISRALLYENIYFHQKVLTAEEMLRYAIKLLDNSGCAAFNDFEHMFKITDEDIFNPHLCFILDNCYKGDGEKDETWDYALSILKKIYDRNLYKRSMAISHDNLIDNNSYNKNEERMDLIKDIFEMPIIDKHDELKTFIEREVFNLYNILSDMLQMPENTELLLVPYPEQTIDYTRINLPIAIGSDSKDYNELFQGENWMHSRAIRKKTHYIVTPIEDLMLAYIATEKVLFQRYGIHLDKKNYFLTKIDMNAFNTLKENISSRKYYSDCYQLAPTTIVYDSADRSKLNKLDRSWRGYQGPLGYKISNTEQIVSFIKQFLVLELNDSDFRVLVDGLLKILDEVVMVDRGKIVNILNGIIKKNYHDKDNILISNIGNYQDSSSRLSYYINDVNDYFNINLKVQNIKDILKEDLHNKKILFIEDACYSGSQIVSIFQEMMGIPIEQRFTKEQHVDELSSTEKEILRNSNILISFFYFNPNILDKLNEELSKLELSNITINYENTFPVKLFDDSNIGNVFRDTQQRDIVKESLSVIGEKLLLDNKFINGKFKDNWTEERIKESRLGYNDAQQLVVLEWNTPTYTLTPLWLKGKIDNMLWHPLFPRIDK